MYRVGGVETLDMTICRLCIDALAGLFENRDGGVGQ